jgi:hypothetical protein
MNPEISIIIVNWNRRDLLAQCLRSILDTAEGLAIQVIVIDNASSDDSADYVEKNFPQVHLTRNVRRIGFAAANNQAIKIAAGSNILLLNSDTIVHSHALKVMSDFLKNNLEAGICSCRLLNTDGSTQPNVHTFPTFLAMLQRYTIFKYLGLFKSARKIYRMRDFTYDKVTPVDHITGAVFMIKKNVLDKVGFMDDKFYFYFEETDLCYRAKQAGFKVYFIPDGRITHLGGASSNLLGLHKTNAMFFKSMFYFFRKYKGKTKTFFYSLVFKPSVLLYLIFQIIWGVPKTVILWLLRIKKSKVEREFTKVKESFLFLLKYGLIFLLY